MTTQKNRYIGRIVSVPDANGFGFIWIGNVTKEDGSPHGLNTTRDIFIHKDDCASELEVGTELSFYVIQDLNRGGDSLRAIGAVPLIEMELLPKGELAIPGFALIVPPVRESAELALRERLPVHINMKPVPEETVEKVIENAPMPRIPRQNDVPQDEKAKHDAVRWLLAMLFPHMANFGTDYKVSDFTDADLDREATEAEENYREMGLEQEIEVMQEEVKRFKEVRGALRFMLGEKLVRRDAIIPIRYLPDLFTAVPVWYFWVNQETQAVASIEWENPDPRPHRTVKYFCELFPGQQRWSDTYQLFNRRVRTLRQYKGEVIPPHVARRMRKAVEVFDYVVIATPYHDQAGKDWEDLKWLRAIDPYVLGFKKGVPFFFVLARFSDAGTFPLFNELVADTIEFLRTNKERLNGFNHVVNPYWFNAVNGSDGLGLETSFGNYLKKHTDQLLAAFEAGNLFDWLRGENPAPATTATSTK